MVAVNEKRPSKWLTPASGYLTGYTHTLNPYTGCAFGCSYCYVRRMPVGLFRKETWGEWVDIKRDPSGGFRREWLKAVAKGPVTVFMASATDPYQPIEYKERVTRSILEAMVEAPPQFVLVQTRSPLVTRDIDLLRELGERARVSMTIESDLEESRKHFAPSAPPLAARWRAVQELREADVPVQIAVSPLLPHSGRFAEQLLQASQRIVVDDFFRGDGSLGRRTSQLGVRALYEELGKQQQYSPETADSFFEELKSRADAGSAVLWGQEGFLP
ncbi:radical SAM protein [Paenibacillus sambharensis]|uniref:Radical SAM protein n=1 Tax=Paenibacillus sambharensis TaxID=1803190 RepID=A0A2W1LR23_9BACL|nr:radical SAM protein [Paenibacillus sambharensis]PZD93857.1 radical SAM protein [Paenibacillus sambharensis]